MSTTFKVHVQEKVLDFELKSTKRLLIATLSITPDQIHISATNDSGNVRTIWSFCQQDLRLIRLKKNAFTPTQHLFESVITGVCCGIGLCFAMVFMSKRPIVTIMPFFIIVPVVTIIFYFAECARLGRLGIPNLAVIVFESTDGKSVNLVIENEQADAIIALFADRDIPVKTLYEPEIQESGDLGSYCPNGYLKCEICNELKVSITYDANDNPRYWCYNCNRPVNILHRGHKEAQAVAENNVSDNIESVQHKKPLRGFFVKAGGFLGFLLWIVRMAELNPRGHYYHSNMADDILAGGLGGASWGATGLFCGAVIGFIVDSIRGVKSVKKFGEKQK